MRPPPDIEPLIFATPEEIDRGIIRRARRKTRRAVLVAIGIALAALFAWDFARAETLDGARIYVIDGDTVRLPGGETVRLYNIDAPETLRARCEAEAAQGFRAKARLAQLLRAAGPRVEISRCEPSPSPLAGVGRGEGAADERARCTDRYGRTLARLTLPAGDAGEILIAEGLATRWPTRRNWCGFERTR